MFLFTQANCIDIKKTCPCLCTMADGYTLGLTMAVMSIYVGRSGSGVEFGTLTQTNPVRILSSRYEGESHPLPVCHDTSTEIGVSGGG